MEKSDMKINKNRPELSSDEINKGKNFNDLMSKYKVAHKPFYKTGWFASGLATLAIVAAITYVITKEDPKAAETVVASADTLKKASAVKPPLTDVNVAYESFTVDAEKGGSFKYKTGSEIKVPANGLVDENGNTVKGAIEIRYREFHDPIDFFLSGIPMKYDSAGIEYHFESAGMVEVQGFQNGKPVFIAPEKEIHVSMMSKQKGTKFNFYSLDTMNGQWKYEGKDKVTEFAEPQIEDAVAPEEKIGISDAMFTLGEEVKAIKEDIKKIEEKRPVAPILASDNRNQFKLDIDPKEFPELSIYKNVKFEIGPENKHFKPEYSKLTWEEASLKENPIVKGGYLLTLSRGKDVQTFSVYPVFPKGVDYDQAVAEFKDKFSTYTTVLNKRKADEKAKQIAYEKELKEWQKDMKEFQKQAATRQAAANTAFTTYGNEQENDVMREFSVKSFGIYNCDAPQMLPTGANVIAQFKDKSGNSLLVDHVYLVQSDKNLMISYYKGDFARFKFNPQANNVCWGVFNDKVVAFKAKDFKGLKKRSGKCDFNMEIATKPLKTKEEIKEFLGI